MAQRIPLPCVSPLHSERTAEPDYAATTASILELPDGVEPTALQLTAGGLCPACARLDAPVEPAPEPE